MMQSLDGFSDEAKIAYQAFVDMSHSKTLHFDCLKAIETLYESGGAASAAEKRELEKLLAHHDKNVMAFKTAIAAVTDDEEKTRLLRFMA